MQLSVVVQLQEDCREREVGETGPVGPAGDEGDSMNARAGTNAAKDHVTWPSLHVHSRVM